MKFLNCCLFAALLLAVGCATEKKEEKAYEETHPVYTTNSPGTKFSLLPAAVQQTITAQAGAAEIKDINKVTGASREVYEIQFSNPGVNPTLYIGEDGTLISEGAVRPVTTSHIGTPTRITNGPPVVVSGGAPGTLVGTENGGGGVLSLMDTLPPNVKNTLLQAYPNATVIDVQSAQRTLYKFTFKDPGLNPRTVISDDGTLYKEISAP